MKYANTPTPGPRVVRVPGRAELAEVLSEGVNLGSAYCVLVHFPSTGECAYYLKDRVVAVDQQ